MRAGPSHLWDALKEASSVVLLILGIMVLWEGAVLVFKPSPIILPAPSALWGEFLAAPSYFLRQALFTLYTTLAGFALAVVLGLALAVGIVHSRLMEKTVYTVLVALNSVPKVALAPLFVIWMGTGIEPKIAIALMLALFSVVIDAVLGLRSVDPDMISLAKASRASTFAILRKIRLPNALPSIFAGLKVAISFALVGAIVGEFVAGSEGLGFAILTAQGQFDTPRVFVCLILLGLLGTALFYVVEAIERLALPWHVSQRSGRAAQH
ncbi:ABC transporter permease [Aquabacter spiritensis]|uniref:NitT/TauT family transport system permease protein n=1 Tax=Aquabacter spiritensis TaxID=933073 RepID=A0A4R3M4J1_9HYPH|nr:ABC transporter permease [Aquabacter spiritensis]TCT06095.1 NitT/TauT family transport system permease protein [Aquabacter spiritensis]